MRRSEEYNACYRSDNGWIVLLVKLGRNQRLCEAVRQTRTPANRWENLLDDDTSKTVTNENNGSGLTFLRTPELDDTLDFI